MLSALQAALFTSTMFSAKISTTVGKCRAVTHYIAQSITLVLKIFSFVHPKQEDLQEKPVPVYKQAQYAVNEL